MQISGFRQTPPPLPPKKELVVKPELDNIADRYNTSRTIGNYTSGLVLGAAKEAVTTTLQAPRLAWEITENLWQAETIGPNLKILGTLAAIPAAALSIPCGPFYGAYQGVAAVADARHNYGTDSVRPPLKRDAATHYARSVTTDIGPEGNDPKTMTGKWIQGLEKLAAGEKPVDIPIIKSVKSLAIGVTAAAVGGIAGAVTMIPSAGRHLGAGVVESLTDSSLGLGGKLLGTAGAVIGGAVHGVSYGVGTFASVTGQGFGETWKKDSVVEGGSRVFSQAWNSIAASVAPKGTLLKERPDFK